jgi:putative transposase
VGSDLDKRMSVLGPHVFDGVPLIRSAAGAGVPLRTAQRWLSTTPRRERLGWSGFRGRTGRSADGCPQSCLRWSRGGVCAGRPPRNAEAHRQALRVAAWWPGIDWWGLVCSSPCRVLSGQFSR